MQLIYKHKNKILVAIMVLMLIPFVFNIGLEWDEPFTMGLIRHGYGSIANLTALDVHPPLYYWVLKAFLSITTFWTSNIFIKIIFARFLSLIFSLVTLYYLIKILPLLNLHYNNYVISFIYFLCPIVYGFEGTASSIRMYSLGAMLCTMCVYYLLLVLKKGSNLRYLIFICLTASLTLYTQYLIAMVAGLYILSALVILVLTKKYKVFAKLLLASIISLILYIPWMPKIISQFSAQSIGLHAFLDMKYIYFYYGIITCMALFIILNEKFKVSLEQKIILYINLLISLLILVINVKFNPYSISVRYTSISLIMNYVIVGIILINNLNKDKIFKILGLVFVILFVGVDLFHINYQKNNQIIPSLQVYKEFDRMKNSKSSVVKTNKYHLMFESNINSVGYSTYLESVNKKVLYPRPINVHVIGNGNMKLFKAVFPNIKNYFK